MNSCYVTRIKFSRSSWCGAIGYRRLIASGIVVDEEEIIDRSRGGRDGLRRWPIPDHLRLFLGHGGGKESPSDLRDLPRWLSRFCAVKLKLVFNAVGLSTFGEDEFSSGSERQTGKSRDNLLHDSFPTSRAPGSLAG